MKPLQLPESIEEPNFAAIDPIDGRYFDSEVTRYLSENSRIYYQAYVEAALAQTLADYKICSKTAADEIESAARKILPDIVRTHERTTRHDVKALVDTIKESVCQDAKPYVHFTATSNDIVATAVALQLRDATQLIILPRLAALIEELCILATRYADTAQIGRTHGQHAVPITFGFFMAEYVSRLGDCYFQITDRAQELRGKFSGAVGAYNALQLFVENPEQFERDILAKLNLQPADYSKQIVPAENIVRLLDELVIAANVMSNLAHDMRHLQRTEIAEVRERFTAGQTGSSTMAHKRNPWNFENIISLSKQVNAQLINANLNIVSEHQRDLTDSASGRFYPVLIGLVAHMLSRLQTVLHKIEIDEQAMQRNLHASGGAIAAEPLYLLLAKYGHTSAHEVAKSLSHQALENGSSMIALMEADKTLKPYTTRFSDAEWRLLRDPEQQYTGLAAIKTKDIVKRWQKNAK